MRKSELLLSLALLASVAASAYYWRELGAERERADSLRQQVAALETSRAVQVSQRVTTAANLASSEAVPASARPAPAVAATPSSPAAPAAAPAPATAMTGMPRNHEEWMARERELLRDPEYREAYRVSRRVQMSGQRDDLVRALNIPTATADQLIDFWIEQNIRNSSREPRADPTNEQELREMQDYFAELKRTDNARLREILGEQKFARYEEYQASRPSRNQVAQLRNQLAVTGDPIREDQVEPLVAALHAERERHQQEMKDHYSTNTMGQTREAMDRWQALTTESLERSHKRLHASATQILSAQQLLALDAMLEREVEMTRSQFALQRFQIPANTPPVAKGP